MQYSYPDNYVNFKEAQIEAHRDGVKEGEALFRKYLPPKCVGLLQKTQLWDKPCLRKATRIYCGKLPTI